jgi:hypothetical protein
LKDDNFGKANCENKQAKVSSYLNEMSENHPGTPNVSGIELSVP